MSYSPGLVAILFAAAVFGLSACAAAGPPATFVAPEFTPVSPRPLPPLPVERPAESTYPSHFGDGAEIPPDSTLALGKFLFFDNALSGDQKLNCASCHDPDRTWVDGLALSIGYPGSLYFRNTPTLLNTGGKQLLYWDGRMADLPTLVRDHVAEAHFMNSDGQLVVERLRQKPQYVQLFREVYGGDPTYGRMLSAVAAYVGSLNSPANPLDRFWAGDTSALSPDAQQGLALFEGKAGCTQCHAGPLLSDGKYHNLGLPENRDIFSDPLRHVTFRRFFRTLGVAEYASLRQDVGLFALTQEEGDRGLFLTPSLREVGLTAPYMHNGVFQTLEEAIAFYNEGGGPGSELEPLGLSSSDQSALFALLQSLASDLPAVEVPELPAYQIAVLGGGQ